MKKLFLLFIMTLICSFALGEDLVYDVSTLSGELTRIHDSDFQNQWKGKWNSNDGKVILECSVNNIKGSTESTEMLYQGNNSPIYSVIASENYCVKKVSFIPTELNGEVQMLNNYGTNEYISSSNLQPLSLADFPNGEPAIHFRIIADQGVDVKGKLQIQLMEKKGRNKPFVVSNDTEKHWYKISLNNKLLCRPYTTSNVGICEGLDEHECAYMAFFEGEEGNFILKINNGSETYASLNVNTFENTEKVVYGGTNNIKEFAYHAKEYDAFILGNSDFSACLSDYEDFVSIWNDSSAKDSEKSVFRIVDCVKNIPSTYTLSDWGITIGDEYWLKIRGNKRVKIEGDKITCNTKEDYSDASKFLFQNISPGLVSIKSKSENQYLSVDNVNDKSPIVLTNENNNDKAIFRVMHTDNPKCFELVLANNPRFVLNDILGELKIWKGGASHHSDKGNMWTIKKVIPLNELFREKYESTYGTYFSDDYCDLYFNFTESYFNDLKTKYNKSLMSH